jgi:phosphate transport system substrate-binding protein
MQALMKASLAVLALLSPYVSIPSASAMETVRINGTGSALVVMKPLMAAFQKENRGVSFDMEKSLGSSASIKAVGKHALDLAVSGRPLKPAEIAEGLTQQEYGKMPFAVVANKRVRVANVTLDDLVALYSGQTAKWPDGEMVRVVMRPNEDVDSKLTRSISPAMDRALTEAQGRKDMLLGITDNDAFESVKKTQGAVGMLALSLVLAEPSTVNVLRLNGVQPSVANISAGKYPYVKHLYLITKKGLPPAAANFVKFLGSPKGRAIAAKYGLLYTGAK